MSRILIIFAHPALEKSRVNRELVGVARNTSGITLHDLYEAYPTFDVDVAFEQQQLLAHDLIILQHPLYWYSVPPLAKQWLDLVLEHGWAYGSHGNALRGKYLLCAVTTGGGANAYQPGGYNRFTLRQFLIPLEQTAVLCKMTFLPPYAVQGTHRMEPAEIQQVAAGYRVLLESLRDDRLPLPALLDLPLLNSHLDTMILPVEVPA